MNVRSPSARTRPPVSRPRSGPRTGRGRFAPGASGNPAGRPARDVERGYLLTLSDTVPPDRWKGICEKAASMAESGDAKAREWLSRYLVGDKCLSDEEPQGRDIVVNFIRPRDERGN